MNRVPAVCDNCNAIFPSPIAMGNVTVTFSECLAEPCPSCGGMGHIPDGTYRFIGDTIALLAGTKRTISELQQLSKILKEVKSRHIQPEAFKERLTKETPKLSSLADILPTTKSEFYAFLSIVIAVISLIIGQIRTEKTIKINVDQVINVIYQNPPKIKNVKPVKNPSNDVKKRNKIGRNDPCPCGSGKKYKQCHLNVK